MKVNPINWMINLIIGWFMVSLLQAIGFALINGGWKNVIPHFKQIAFFKDSMGALINLIAIVVLGTIGTFIWFRKKKSK